MLSLLNLDFLKELLRFIKKWFISILLSIWTHTFGIFSLKSRNLIVLINEFYNAKIFDLRQELKKISINELFQNLSCDIVFPESKAGEVSLLELCILNTFIKKYRPERIFEFGTFRGRCTLNFAINSPKNSKIFTLDLPCEGINATKFSIEFADRKHIKKNASGELFLNSNLIEKNKITQLYGDSATFNYNKYLNTIDFIFIDGSHHYDYVINDTNIALKLLRRGKGIIIWHDYGAWPGVTKALNEFSKKPLLRKIMHIENTSLAFIIL